MGFKRIKLNSISSTNSYIAELIKIGEVSGETLVTTDYQEDGRGQGTHSWHSKRGENLLMSILLYPAFLSASQQFQLSRLTSLAICDTLVSLGLDPVIKWPNDILTVHGKIAGILIEHGISGGNISHTIIGIGLNLNQEKFPEFPLRATSVAIEKGITVVPSDIAEQLLKKIEIRYGILREGNSAVLEKEYLDRLYTIDQQAFFLIKGIEYPGVIRGVTRIGELQVEIEGKIESFGHQEIKCLVYIA